jgi:hypothetical protein
MSFDHRLPAAGRDLGQRPRTGRPFMASPRLGISSRALFNLDEEDRGYRTSGTQAFINYQREHERELL